MAHEDDLPAPESPPSRRRWRAALVGVLFLLAVALGYGWTARKTIADHFLERQLQSLGLPGTYEVSEIGPGEQVVRNLVIGDPTRPDLTIEEVRVKTRLRFGFPGIGRITIIRPRLYGTVLRGKPSFGTLDRVLFTGSKEPFRLPDYDLAIADGRAQIQTDYGPVSLRVSGEGELRDGFEGRVAAIMPRIEAQGCLVQTATVAGKLSVSAEKPRFTGPLQIAGAHCSAPKFSGPDIQVGGAKLQADITLSQALDGAEGQLDFVAGKVEAAQARLARLKVSTKFTVREAVLAARYDVEGEGVAASHLRAGKLKAAGWLRTAHDGTNLQIDGDVTGSRILAGQAIDKMLAQAQGASAGTLAEPLLAKSRTAFARETQSSSLDGRFLVRRSSDGLSLIVPQASLRGGSGQSLIAISRLQMLNGAKGLMHLSGSFLTGGVGMPRIVGRMEREGSGRVSLNVKMPAYQAERASLSIPDMAISMANSGAVAFSGKVLASGGLPGGHAQNLALPIDGIWRAGELSVWPHCTRIRFDSLALANLTLDRRELEVCPARGRALLRFAGGKLDVAGGVSALNITGRLGETPVRMASGPVGFAYPGIITAQAIDVRLGPAETASHFRIANLSARAGQDIAGTFDGSDVELFAVPLDLRAVRGDWRFADGVLALTNGSFRLEDREQVDRFQPVVARDATLTLRDNVIHADAVMREPTSDRVVVAAQIRHDLSNAHGRAQLAVKDITFDDKLQPETLSRLALGVVANTVGSVRGDGQIVWDDAGVRSTGAFTTDNLDFAAAFGPVKGVSGTIRFTDLLGLVTAPDQQMKVAAINPGIEVNDGVITYALEPDLVIAVKGGVWPFVGGVLELRPTRMAVGTDSAQTYTLVVTGADAALFVQRLEISNLNATGTFDGTLPLVFDQNGGRIEGGKLQSRPPGGNVSYVGELTYEDLSAMANFAFATLRSLDYRDMTIGMNGALEGEILTRISFSGVKQGNGTSQNFITRRIAKLPLRFNVNLRAPFFQLVSSFKSFYDPALVRDPRSLGLLDGAGEPRPDLSAPKPSSPNHSIQPDASEIRP